MIVNSKLQEIEKKLTKVCNGISKIEEDFERDKDRPSSWFEINKGMDRKNWAFTTGVVIGKLIDFKKQLEIQKEKLIAGIVINCLQDTDINL